MSGEKQLLIRVRNGDHWVVYTMDSGEWDLTITKGVRKLEAGDPEFDPGDPEFDFAVMHPQIVCDSDGDGWTITGHGQGLPTRTVEAA